VRHRRYTLWIELAPEGLVRRSAQAQRFSYQVGDGYRSGDCRSRILPISAISLSPRGP